MTVLDNNPNGASLGGAVVDPSGNAWVTVEDVGVAGEVPWVLKVVESNGAAGTWQAPVTLATSLYLLGGGQIVVDPQGRITVIYAYAGGAPYQYLAVRYLPGGGWQEPVTLVASPDEVETIGTAVDSAGNVILAYRQLVDHESNEVVQLWSVTIDAGTGIPGAPQKITGTILSPFHQALAQSPDGSQIMLAYSAEASPPGGFSIKSYNPASQSWGSTLQVPWSSLPGFDVSGNLHLTVDNSGNATMLLDYTNKTSNAWTVYGYRYENGRWQASVPVFTTPNPPGAYFNIYGNMIVDGSGVVLGVMPYTSPQNIGSEYAFRYTPGVGWDTETVITPLVDPSYSWASTFDGGGVAIYEELENDDFEASLYQNGAWSALPPVPDVLFPEYISTALAPTGAMLLAEGTGAVVQATWLEP
jgi:hypothetical protein